MASQSATVQAMLALVGQVAATDATALVVGETGAGKPGRGEADSRALEPRGPALRHPEFAPSPRPRSSRRSSSATRPASSGARRHARSGQVHAAARGTLFIDQVAELSLGAQDKLLRLLDDRQYLQCLGDVRPRCSDIRVIAATRADLAAAVQERAFRPDLFHRLNVVRIEVPALRDRAIDIPHLAADILHDLALRHGRPPLTLTPEALDALTAYAWPGNIRELVNALERAVVVAPTSALTVALLPEELRRSGAK